MTGLDTSGRLPGVGEKFIAGDPLRAVCAIMVVTFHVALIVVGYQSYRFGGVDAQEAFGEVGGAILTTLFLSVYVFLSLSGYLVGRPFLRAYVLGRKQPRIRPYARNRVVRIAPLFLLVWTVTWILHTDLIRSWRDVVEPYLLSQIYRPTDLSRKMIHAWTVDVEAVFYVTLPLVVVALAWAGKRLSPWGRAWLFLIPLLIASAVSLALRVGTTSEPPYFQPHTLVFAFAPGLALALLEPLVAPKLRARGNAGPLLGAMIALLVVTSVATTWVGIHNVWVHTLAGIAGAMFIAIPLVRQWARADASRLLDHKWLHWIGERSYSIYLTHLLVREQFAFISEDVESAWLALLLHAGVVFAVTLPLSALSYRFIELPFLRLKQTRGSFTPVAKPGEAAAAAALAPQAAKNAP